MQPLHIDISETDQQRGTDWVWRVAMITDTKDLGEPCRQVIEELLGDATFVLEADREAVIARLAALLYGVRNISRLAASRGLAMSVSRGLPTATRPGAKGRKRKRR